MPAAGSGTGVLSLPNSVYISGGGVSVPNKVYISGGGVTGGTGVVASATVTRPLPEATLGDGIAGDESDDPP